MRTIIFLLRTGEVTDPILLPDYANGLLRAHMLTYLFLADRCYVRVFCKETGEYITFEYRPKYSDNRTETRTGWKHYVPALSKE
jgi:hypothetical protein